MRIIPSQVYGAYADTPNIGFLLPSYVPTPEQYVYDYVLDTCGVTVNDPLRPTDTFEVGTRFPLDIGTPFRLPVTFNQKPPMLLYANENKAGNRAIPVVRGWPPYPGQVPMIGVALGNDSDNDGEDSEGGGFAGDAWSYDDQGNLVAMCAYYAEPMYSTIVVELIHENRDERDRLHDELRRALFPLRHRLNDRCPLIRRVRIDAEKQELPIDEQPLVIYISLFTVHVYYEMLLAADVTGPDGTIGALHITVLPNPAPVNQTIGVPVEVGGIAFATQMGSEAPAGVVFPADGEGLTFNPVTELEFPVAPDTGP